jgi:hypothetical protein
MDKTFYVCILASARYGTLYLDEIGTKNSRHNRPMDSTRRARAFTGKRGRRPKFRGTAMTSDCLRESTSTTRRRACGGNKPAAVRLIEREKNLEPSFKTVEAIDRAIEKLARDSGGYSKNR